MMRSVGTAILGGLALVALAAWLLATTRLAAVAVLVAVGLVSLVACVALGCTLVLRRRRAAAERVPSSPMLTKALRFLGTATASFALAGGLLALVPPDMLMHAFTILAGDDPEAEILTPQESLAHLQLAPGYRATLFASEVDFPIGAPVAMTFDDRGRLWVASAPTYPHLFPGERPSDQLVILEDRDGDGRADRHTVFAEDLYLPMGFAVVEGGALVAQPPELWFLEDTDSDDRADRRRVLASGFGTADSHHTISAFEWGPGGGLYLHEGTFLHSQVETPYGPKRLHDGGIWRFDPRTLRIEPVVSFPFANPWGHAFDEWGQSAVCDASGGQNYYYGHLAAAAKYPDADKTLISTPLLPVSAFAARGRPTSGCEFVDSAAFAPADQGRFVWNQVMGFHGARWNHVRDEDSGWAIEPETQDLFQTSDPASRPVALEFGPDGALYVLDFYSPIIGHMQYSLRDARRDKKHARIWRIFHEDGALNRGPDIADASIEELVALLAGEESRHRFHARRRLQQSDAAKVLPVLRAWVGQLDAATPQYDHHLLEALWTQQGLGAIDTQLLEQLLSAHDHRARAAAARVFRYLIAESAVDGDPAATVRRLLDDGHPRVRLEGLLASGRLPSAGVEPAVAARLALSITQHEPLDGGTQYVLDQTLAFLGVASLGVGDDAATRPALLRGTGDTALFDLAPANDVTLEILSRSAIPPARKRSAVEELARAQDVAPAETAVALLDQAKATAGRAVLADVLMEAGLDELRRVRMSSIAASDPPDTRALELAVRLRLEGTAALAGNAPPVLDQLLAAGYVREPALRDALRPLAEIALAAPDAGIPELRAARPLASDPRPSWTHNLARLAGFDRGEPIYAEHCSTCHQRDGRGISNAFPALDASPWVRGNPERAAAIALHGLAGPIEVSGKPFHSLMPPLGSLLDDQEIADVVTYVRNAWSNRGSAVAPGQVAALRAQHPRTTPWTQPSLLGAFPLESETAAGREETQ